MRTPVAPTGWPSEIPEPLTFRLSLLVPGPSRFSTPSAWACERLVELDQVDVVRSCGPCRLKSFSTGGYRAETHRRPARSRRPSSPQGMRSASTPYSSSLSSETMRQAAAASFCCAGVTRRRDRSTLHQRPETARESPWWCPPRMPSSWAKMNRVGPCAAGHCHRE
jgi:hypothetical protein